ANTPLTAQPSLIRVVLQIVLVVVAVAACLWALHRLAFVILVVTIAALFAYVVAPLVHVVERPIRVAGRSHRLSRASAIAVVYLLIAGFAAAGMALLLPSVIEQ